MDPIRLIRGFVSFIASEQAKESRRLLQALSPVESVYKCLTLVASCLVPLLFEYLGMSSSEAASTSIGIFVSVYISGM